VKIYSIEFKTSAVKELKRLPKIIQVKILSSMKLLAVDPFSPLLPIRKMEGRSNDNRFRFRMGRYRVVYEVQRDRVVIFVVRVGHRKDVYR
jgi:mRNA interferase RelE/StbE